MGHSLRVCTGTMKGCLGDLKALMAQSATLASKGDSSVDEEGQRYFFLDVMYLSHYYTIFQKNKHVHDKFAKSISSDYIGLILKLECSRHTKTRLTWAVYVLRFLNGLRHGQGVCHLKGCYQYSGSWSKDSRHGEGCCKYAGGAEYFGEWKNDLRNGKGILKGPGEYKYDGEWLRDEPEGQGANKKIETISIPYPYSELEWSEATLEVQSFVHEVLTRIPAGTKVL